MQLNDRHQGEQKYNPLNMLYFFLPALFSFMLKVASDSLEKVAFVVLTAPLLTAESVKGCTFYWLNFQ